MKNFEERIAEIETRLYSADTGKHPIGALIIAVSQLTEIVKYQNEEIEEMKKWQGVKQNYDNHYGK